MRFTERLIVGLGCQPPVSADCVFDASLVPGTCLHRFVDLKGFIQQVPGETEGDGAGVGRVMMVPSMVAINFSRPPSMANASAEHTVSVFP